MASRGRGVLLRLTGDSSDARRAVNDVRSDLRRFSREEATARIEIQTARAERTLERLREQLANLSKQTSTPSVELRKTRIDEQIKLLEFRLARLGAKRVQIDVDLKRGALERTAAGLGAVERGIGRVTTGFGDALRAIPIFGQIFATVLQGAINLASTLGTALGSLVTSGIETLANTFSSLSKLGGFAGAIGGAVAGLAGIAAQFALIAALGGAVAIALNAVLGAVVALGVALGTLVVSLTAAIAGFAALAAGLGALLIPVVVVAIGLFTRFHAILQARQAQQQKLAQATQAQKTAEQQMAAALDARKRAEEQLANATVEGRKAMEQAVIDERDAELGLRNARNGVQNARLQLAQAKRDLRDFLKTAGVAKGQIDELLKRSTDVSQSPAQLRNLIGDVGQAGGAGIDKLDLQEKLQAIKNAQLGVANATNQVSHSERDLSEARKKQVDFANRGLNAYRPYRQALEAVARANRQVSKAQSQSSAAQRKYEQALKNLSKTEQGTLSRLNSLIDGFKRLAKAFTDPIFKAMNEVFDSLKGKGDGLRRGLVEVGKAFGDFVRSIGAFLREPRTGQAFGIMAHGAADLVRQLGAGAFVNFLRIMREVAITVMPTLLRMARDVNGAFARLAGQPGRIHHATSFVVAQFRTWLRLAGSLIGLVRDIFVPAATAGGSLADSMRHVVDHWREWIRQNPEKVREFINHMVNRARRIVHWLIQAAAWLSQHLPAAAEAASNAFKDVYAWAKKVYDIVKKVIDLGKGKFKLFGKEIDLPGPLDIAKGPMLLPKALAGSGGQNVIEKTISKALEGAAKPKRPQTRDLRSPDARTASASGHTVINNFNIPPPLDATKPIDPPHTAKLLQLAWEAQGGGLS